MELSHVPEATSSDHMALRGPKQGARLGEHWTGHPAREAGRRAPETISFRTGTVAPDLLSDPQVLQTPSSAHLGETGAGRLPLTSRHFHTEQGRGSAQSSAPLSFQYIPMPVLYGVFLYMGVASLNGIQVRPSLWGQRSESGSVSPRPQVLAFPVQ